MPNPTLGTGLKVNARYIHIVVSFPTHKKKIRLRFSVHEPGCIKHLALTVALTGMVSTDRMPVILLERIAWTIGQLLMLCIKGTTCTVQVVPFIHKRYQQRNLLHTLEPCT